MVRNLSLSYGPLAIGPDSQVVVLYADSGETLSGEARAIWNSTGKDFATLAQSLGFEARQGQAIDLVSPHGMALSRLIVLGRRGSADAVSPRTAWADRGGSLVAKLTASGVRSAEIVIDEPDATPELIAEMAAGAALRHYSFTKYRTSSEARPTSLDLTIRSRFGDAVQPLAEDRLHVAEGTMIARDLVNEPPNALGPEEFAAEAARLADLGVSVEVLEEADMARLGMGALLAVGRGSERRPRLVVLRYEGGRKDAPPLAFVGKGVVFDTGGISIKGAASMEDMKGDMGGAAAVVGLFHALAARRARVNAVGVVGLVENMPDGRSYRPGDILRTMSGKTVEVVNTDAEGRLVLADALWYTQDRFKPRVMIDLATLTGAMLVALGHGMGGLFSNTESLIAELHAAGRETGEPLWHMPLAPYYEKLIESRFADLKNSGGRKGGSSTAAHFLQHFVGDVPWAHLDIAGVAFGTPASETNASWATGFGVALLDRFIRDNYETAR